MEKLFKNVYQVVENPNEEQAGIEIIDGEFKGLVYQYGKVQFEDCLLYTSDAADE